VRETDRPYMTPVDAANFLAAKAVAHATAFLDGRNTAAELGRHADAMQTEIMTSWGTAVDLNINAILDPVRLLNFAMMRASLAAGDVQDGWMQVMGALVELIRKVSAKLREPASSGARP
jgi:hypothetical protein